MLEMLKCLSILLRNWIQATFTLNSAGSLSPNNQHGHHTCEGKEDKLAVETSQKSDIEEIDLSVDFSNMFGISRYLDEVTLVFLITHLK
jgi:methyltransferase-like protein 6